MAKKMPGRLVALSASAVATIYVAGLLSTQPAADSVAAASAGADTALVASPSASQASTAADPTSTPAIVVSASATTSPTRSSTTATAAPTASAASTPSTVATSTSAATSTAASTSTYADGTYTGTGTSRFGNVSVSVTVSGGTITNVQITRVTTSFPASRIASLPAQVIQSQTANVNVVTGATYSSQAFKQAVQHALTQAQAARSTAAAG